MTTMRQRVVDALGWGFGLWLLGFALGMMLFPFVPVARLGWFILPVMTVVTIFVAYRRLRQREKSLSYFILVGIVWLLLAVVLDYVFLVKAFQVQEYYDFDIWLYYALTVIIPVAVGMLYSRDKTSIVLNKNI